MLNKLDFSFGLSNSTWIKAERESFISRSIGKLMEYVNIEVPPKSEAITEIEAGDAVMRTALWMINAGLAGESDFVMLGADKSAVAMMSGMRVYRSFRNILSDSFISHRADGSCVMHYAGGKKVRCLPDAKMD
jgi:hypothetical protein